MKELQHTKGDWKVRTTIDNTGDYPFPTYDIMAIHSYGPEGIGTAYQNPYNANLFACSREMLDALILAYTSIKKACDDAGGCPFECTDANCEDCIHPKNERSIKSVIEKATGKTIEEVLE